MIKLYSRQLMIKMRFEIAYRKGNTIVLYKIIHNKDDKIVLDEIVFCLVGIEQGSSSWNMSGMHRVK